MPDVSAKIKGLNVEFNDNLTTSPNIDSGDDIKTSFARIHKRFSDMKTGAYEDIADQYYPSGEGSEKLVTGEIVQSAIESVSGDIEHIEYALKNLSKEIYNDVEMPITTGYYISGITEGDDWTQHMDADSSSQYLENAFYLGARQINKKLKFTVADHRSTSVRCFGFCDENNIVTSYYKESWDIWEQNQDGTYTATLPISGPYFFLSYSELEIIGFEISEELINQTGYVSPNGSDTNGGSTMDFAFKTVSKALSEGCTRIILDGGSYYQRIDLSLAHGKHIDIISYDRAYRPVFYDPDCILANSATLSDGVYSATISQTISSNNIWLYQDGTPYIETQIAESERLPVQRGKNCRLEDTRIEKCYADNLADALAEIKSSSIYKWYLDSNTIYFTSPTEPSQSNPICFGTGNDLFSGADRSISIRLSGIKCKYMSLNLKNLCNAEAIDCCATNIFGWGAITWDNTLNAYFLRCEASSCSNGTNGDGFNADVTNTGEAFSKHYTATLIDCWSHDNMDDGYSDHRHAETTVIGGLFEYNGKAGLTPVHGAHCSCYNVYSRKNYTGFMCAGDVEEAEGGKFTQMICYNCVAELNNRAGNETGFYVDGLNNRMTLISCKAIGNPTAYYVGETASLKMVDCTSLDNNRFIHGYPSNATVETTGMYRYLSSGSNLNDFSGASNIGNYLCTNTNAPTILNKPTAITTTFRMDVMSYNDQTTQIIYPNDNLCLYYTRFYNGTAWSDWKESATAMQILSYGNSTWNDFITVYNKNAVVYCRASSNSNPATGSQTRMAFMAYVNNGTDPTEVEFQYYRSVSSHTDSQQGDQVYVYKLNKTNGWSVTTRNAFSKINVSTPITKSYASQQITLGHADSGVTAGTYNSVTVDAMGHVTGGSNPTTLSGYGITDANINNGTITLGNNTIAPITSFSSLDSPAVGGSGKYISSISETDGIISATETSMDTTPTENSTNAITSGAVYTDSANQQLEIDYAINTGAKNLFKIRDPFTNTRNNVTFVVNSDGTVDVSTTSDGASAQTDLTIGTVDTYEGVTYKLTGCPSGVTGLCACGTGGTGSVIDTGSGALLTPTADGSRSPFVRVYNGAVITTPVKFYPMIRLAEIKNNTFEPYAPTNKELYDMVANQELELTYAINTGVKNILKSNAVTQTINGITFTVNDDWSVSASGTATDTADYSINSALPMQPGTYILSGCPYGGGSDFRIQIYQIGYDSGDGFEFTIDSARTINVYLRVFSGKTVNITFKPMIRDAVIKSTTYEPYAPTNIELEEEIAYAINTGAKNLINYDGLGYTSKDGATRTTRGVTFTLNSDGTVSCSGTNDGTGVSRCRLFIGNSLLHIQDYCTGGYMLSGCPANGSNSTYYLSAYANTSPTYSVLELGSGSILKTQSVSGDVFVEMVIGEGVDSTGIVFKPMVRDKYIKSTTFELYAKTNRELTVAENENRSALIGQVNGGAKNMIDASDFVPSTKNGITLTKNADDSFTITGTFTSRVTSFFTIDSIIGTESTVLAFEGGESGIYAYARNGNPEAWLTSSGGVPITTGVPIPAQNVGASFDIAIMVSNTDGRFDNYVFNKTVRTMICTDADYTISPTFEPYAPTNRELYETKLDIESGRTTDISTTVKAGIYRYYGTGATTGLPSDITDTAPFGMLQVLTDDSYITQLLYSYVSAALAPAPDLYIRRSADSGRTWTPWLKSSANNIAFGTCDSTADAQIKAVTITDSNWTRTVGGIIAVKFSNTNTFSATASDKIKLSVNGEEAEIYYNNAASPTGTNTACYGYANRYVYYIWDGTYWVWYSHGTDNNTTYSSMSEAEIRAGTSTTARLITPARLNLAIRGLGTSLSSGADLNTLLTSGAYYTSTAAIAKSCTHRPAYSNDSNTLFRLEVLYIASTSILMQKLYTIQTSGTEIRQIHEYYRGYQSSTWGSWRQVTDTTIADYTG